MKTNLRLKLSAVFEAAPEGGSTCYFEEFPDVFSEGETIESTKANLHDALQLVLEYHRDEARKKRKALCCSSGHGTDRRLKLLVATLF
jgi:predicted RNase H-like HicB family nuclease